MRGFILPDTEESALATTSKTSMMKEQFDDLPPEELETCPPN